MSLRVCLVAAVALLASAAHGEERQPSPTIRPILTSNDPAGDNLVVCYVAPVTHTNGYRDLPEALPEECVVEITDTLQIARGYDDRLLGHSNEPAPGFVVDLLLGPQNEVVTLPNLAIDGVYLRPGTRTGIYRFRGHVGRQPVEGGFTIRLSSKRVLQLRYANEEQQTGAYVALAGYPRSATVRLNVYNQISFRPDVGTGERRWRYESPAGAVTVDARGEALVRLPFDVHSRGNFLLVTEPQQQNDLYSASRIVN